MAPWSIGALRDTRRLAQVPFEQKDVAAKVLLSTRRSTTARGTTVGRLRSGRPRARLVRRGTGLPRASTVAALHGAIEGARVEAG